MKYIFTAITSIFFSGIAIAQNNMPRLQDYTIQTWTTHEGLYSNNLRQVVQDSKGYIWISSFNGLVRFDGHTFDIFNTDKLPELKSNGFTVITEDRQGNLYFGTLISGLLKYDGISFKLFNIETSFSKSITAIFADSDNNIWLGAQNGGVYFFDQTTGAFTKITNPLVDGITISCIIETSAGEVLMATLRQGVIVYKEGEFNRLPGNMPAGIQITCLREAADKLIIGTSNGVYEYDRQTWLPVGETAGHFVNFLDYDRFGNLWVATETGLLRIVKSGGVEALGEADGLPSRQISSITFDTEDNIWLSTKRGGLVILKKSNFTNISVANGLSSPFVNTVYQRADGAVLVGSDNGDVDVIEHTKITKMPLQTNLTNVSIKDISQDQSGNIWLATYKGVIKVKGRQEQLLTVKEGIPSNNPRCLFTDDEGNVWVGAKDGGLLRIDPAGKFTIFSDEDGLSDNYVFCIEQLPNGNIIAGTYRGGLNIIDADGRITVLNVEEDNSSPQIFNLYVVNDTEYWLATDVGLFKYQQGKFYAIDKRDGLLVKTIFDVHFDDYGYIWLTSNLGVVRLSKESVEAFLAGRTTQVSARLYDEKDGMLTRECTGATKMYAAKKGNIWIPTSNGLAVVDPGDIYVNKKVPPVYIKAITVDGAEVSGDLSKITLKPGTQRLTIDYTALSYYSPGKINFMYRLKGYEKEWNEVGNQYRATYMNLPDGNFTFEVKAANNDGVWNEVPATIEIHLDPFFYESRLFYLLMATFLLAVAFLLYWIRIRVVEEKNRELHKLNTELDSFVYSVSHDLRAPLSSILGLINVSKIDEDKENLPVYLEKIEASVNKLDDFIKEIISYSRNVRLKVDIEEVDLRALVEEVLEGLAYMNPENKVKVMVESSANTLFRTDKIRLTIILNNIISNAFRYYKSYINDAYVKIKIMVTPSRGVITIADNGIGIKPDRLKKIFDMFYRATDAGNGSGLGLYIAKESVLKLEGTLTVDSEFERGTTFTITLPSL